MTIVRMRHVAGEAIAKCSKFRGVGGSEVEKVPLQITIV